MENIENKIEYIEKTKIVDIQKDIDYYKKVGARKDLTRLTTDLQDLQNIVQNLKSLLKNGPQKNIDLKVRVTTYKNNLIIETKDCENFDEDFIPNGLGLIGCLLKNTARLGISTEALKLVQTFKKVGDVIGDLMGEEDNFTWIGGPHNILSENSVVCRYFKMPVGYTLIDNITSDEAKHHIDDKKNGSISIEYADFEQELWIELSKSGSWKTITTDQGTQEEKYVYNDYYTLQNIEGSRFVGGRLYDPEVLILNTPENMIKQNSDKSRKILICEETREEIFKTCQNIFRKEDESTWNIKIYDDEIMCYINPLFDLGFDNNVMHPHETNWRMSITATPKTILEKLKAFKKEELSTI